MQILFDVISVWQDQVFPDATVGSFALCQNELENNY